MKDNKKFLVGLIAIVAVICVISLLVPKGEKTSQQALMEPKAKSGYEIMSEMRETITKDYLDKYVDDLLRPHFETIDSVRRSYYPDYIKVEESYDGYHSYVHLTGFVYGKAKLSPNGPYYYSIHGNITYKNINNPVQDSLDFYIDDKNDNYIYYKGRDLAEANKQRKEREKAEKKSKQEKQAESRKGNQATSSSDYSSPNYTKNIVKTGKTVYINATCIGAIDESTLDKISKSASRGDEGVMKVAVASGYAIVVQQGTSATIVSIRTGKVRVRLSDGRMVWVLYKHVK